ncbi:heme peroxidase [Moniliophthora roreri MCA 2997]|uniref:Heme peroxidase n=1 Tax=Moniliophthora roreri (strain MCA 2997) TaxID=1381753 RepID=V2WUL7_MONRO|nr:heme peroxidase [Moniliophthora roreri MCA 2997]
MLDMTAELEHKAKSLQKLMLDGPLVKFSDLPAYINAVTNKDSINDRYLLLERLLVLMSRLGDSTQESEPLRKLGSEVQAFVIDLLYKDLPHPPSSYLSVAASSGIVPAASSSSSGPIKYAFRSADGSDYNPLFPALGKARTPYARSVPSIKLPPLSSLPDPGLVFDTLLRRDKFVEHPGGVSSLFFAFADLVIHSIFNTDPKDPTINNTSSYLDLSILYGSSDAEVNSVRRKDGTGRLWDDVFADGRLLLMPPASCALLILLCRNHNYIADKILNINERRAYKDPEQLSEQERATQDDEIFQRARLVNSGYFVQIILGDYVGTILGLARDGRDWRLNPLMEMRQLDHEIAPRGEGNVVSIEFNLLYRWHATLSEEDASWTEKIFRQYLGDADLSQVTPAQFHDAARTALGRTGNVREWTFHGLKRANGRFSDADLADLIMNATEYRAGAFKARNIPAAMRVIEILGIEQSRKWGVCSLNEFRKFIGLKPYDTFEQWNSDESVAAAARSLYKHIDNLELHVGLQAEEAKQPGPGAGLCPGYTISRAILADAVCLTRGDRFLTVDFTPYNLTTWGYEDCQFNVKDGSYGGMLTKLLFRTLPDHYEPRSAYAHFPFLVPSYMEKEMKTRDAKTSKGEASKYIWTRPPPPKPTTVVGQFEDVHKVLQPEFLTGQDQRLAKIIGHQPPDVKLTQQVLFANRDEWSRYFVAATKTLIQSRSIKSVGKTTQYIDIVKDVLNVLPIKWICEQIAGLHIRETTKRAHWTEQQYVKNFQDVCRYVFLNTDPTDDWELRESSIKTFQYFSEDVQEDFKTFSSWISDKVSSINEKDDSRKFLKQLFVSRGAKEPAELAASLFCEVVPTAAHFSQALAHVINFYLDEARRESYEAIISLSTNHATDAHEKLVKYVHDALSHDPPVSGLYLTATKESVVGGNRVRAGQRVFASLVEANKNRPQNQDGVFGITEHGLLYSPLFTLVAPRILATVLSLPNVRRAPGESGKLNRFVEYHRGAPIQQYVTYEGSISPFPDSLLLQYDRVA